jgi:lysophospholipase L1-like esterase
MTGLDGRVGQDGAASAQGEPRWRRYVALGDSFTEGLDDRDPADPTIGDRTAPGRYRGWADRVAAALAARDPPVRYANLAVRGKLLAQVCDEGAAALALGPTAAGVNDALRRLGARPAAAGSTG